MNKCSITLTNFFIDRHIMYNIILLIPPLGNSGKYAALGFTPQKLEKIEEMGIIFPQLFYYMSLWYISIMLWFQFFTVNINEIIMSWIDLSL